MSNQISRIVKKYLNESFAKYTMFERRMFCDDVISRIGEYGDEYVDALNQLNSQYPVTKYKRD
jgi:hypothetical protein